MSRRNGRRLDRRASSVGAGGVIGPATLQGLQGFSATPQLATGAGLGLRGSLTGQWIAVLHRVDAQAGNVNKELVRNTDAGDVAGYRLSLAGTSTALSYVCSMTGPASVASPVYTVVAGDVGKLMLSWGVWDQTAGKIRLYPKNATEQGTGTVTALAMLPAGGTNNMTVGRYNISGVNFADNETILAVMGGDGFIPTPAEIAVVDTAVKATGALPIIAGKTTHRWPVSGWAGTVTDSVGTDNLTLLSGVVADLTLVSVARVWA